MPIMTLFAFVFLSCSLLSIWIRREPKIWGTLLFLSIISGMIAGHITGVGLVFILLLTLLWWLYDRKPNVALFIALVCLSMSFKLRLLPGYDPYFITPKFAIGLDNPLIGLFPLALLVPLAKDGSDWRGVIKGIIFGCVGIAILALLATISGATQWDFKLPPNMGERLFSNLILTCIPEEGFFRGFVQNTLANYFKNIKLGKALALILASLLFAVSHIFWSPNLGNLLFTFFAGLLYGGVYWYSKKIESAIICHFLLNLIHMTFFAYHRI